MKRIVTIAGVALVAAAILLWFCGNATPNLVIPAPAVVSGPNGFNDLARAATLVRDEKVIATALPRPDAMSLESSRDRWRGVFNGCTIKL